MKTVHSQKGFSPLVVIIIGIIVFVLIVLLINAWVSYSSIQSKTAAPNNQLSNQQTQTSTQSIPGLEKIETDTYTFYYPKGYVKSDKDMGSAKVLYYVTDNKKDTKEGITLNMYPTTTTTRMETPTSDFCKMFLQFSLRGVKNVRIVDAKPVDLIKSHGCDFLYVDDSVPGKLAAHQKHLWYKEGDNLDGYSSKATYLLTSSQADKETLDQAVNNFKLK